MRSAPIARDRGCGRIEWNVLDWNEPSIAFYRSLGAQPMEAWLLYRLTGDAMEPLAASDRSLGRVTRRPALESAHLVDLVDEVGAVGGELSLADRLDLVDPGVALVAGVEQRCRVRRRRAGSAGEVEPAAVGDVDRRAVVGLDEDPDVERALGAPVDREPVGGGVALEVRR